MDVQARIKSGFRDRFGFVEAVLPTKSGLSFLARFTNESSVHNALQTEGSLVINHLILSIKPAYKSKWLAVWGRNRRGSSGQQRFGSSSRPGQGSVVGQPPLNYMEPARPFEQEPYKPPPPFMPPNLPAMPHADNAYLPKPGDPSVSGFFPAQAMASKAAMPVAPIPSQIPGQADTVVATRSPSRPSQGGSSRRKQKASVLQVEDSQTKPPAVEVLNDGKSFQGKSETKPASVRVALPSETTAPAPLNPSLDDKFPPDNITDKKSNEGARQSEQGEPEPQTRGLDAPLRKMSMEGLIQAPLEQPAKPGKEKSHGRREDESSSENWQLNYQGLDGANLSRIESESSSQHPRAGPDVTPVEKQPRKQEKQPKKQEKQPEKQEKQPEKQEEQPKREEGSEPTAPGHYRLPSIFTEEEIKGRKQAWDRIPMPLNPQKAKKRNLPISAKPASSASKVHAVEDKLQTSEGKTHTVEGNQTPRPLPKTQPPPLQQTKADQSVDPSGFQLVSPRRKKMWKGKQNPQTLTIRENQRRGVESQITNFFGLLPGQQVTIEAEEHSTEEIKSPDVSSNPPPKGNESSQAAPLNETPPTEQSQPKNKKKKKNKKTKRNQSVSSLVATEEPCATEKLPEETNPTHSSESPKTDCKADDPQIPSDGNKPSETPDSSGHDTLGFKAGAPFGSGGTLKMPKKRAKRPQVTDSHWEPQKGPEIKTPTGAGQSGLESEASSPKVPTPTSETSSGLNPLAADFVSPPAENQSSDEDSDMSLMLGVFGQLAQNKREMKARNTREMEARNKREKRASGSSSSETIDFEEGKYMRQHTCDDQTSCRSRSESLPHIIFTKGKQPEIKFGKGKEPMGPATKIEEGPAMKKKEEPQADPGDPGDPGDPDEPGDQPGLVNDSWPKLPPRELLTQDMLLNDAPAAWKRR
ncbi:unnamed protein product [Clonostachys solani]|uniref:Uncharacterized protein n=1 Tax=Clonostachys solani TaxID=160281 RepID=A0A9N9VY56_9HYPO|nr:unnamed protein product [Clonostachys solani]